MSFILGVVIGAVVGGYVGTKHDLTVVYDRALEFLSETFSKK